jgi:riboflavin synthase
MFTGIIETLGQVKQILRSNDNVTFQIASSLSSELKIDQSLSHDGVCLTVIGSNSESHTVTAIDETLNRSTLGALKTGDIINLERCLTLSSRLDGHLVQGHVDCVVLCLKKETKAGSWIFTFDYPSEFSSLLVQKGSITINGVSLTISKLSDQTFSVAIIPYTFENTSFCRLNEGMCVNIEFDILGKYVQRHLELLNKKRT